MHVRAHLVAAISALALSAPAQALDAKHWFPSQPIGGKNMVNPHAAVGRDGGAFVLFARSKEPFDQVGMTERPPGGAFSAPVVLDWLKAVGVGLGGVATTYDWAGRLVAVWQDTSGPLRWAVREPTTGEWHDGVLAPREASGGMATVKADSRGRVYAAWFESRDPNRGCCEGPFVATMHDGTKFGAPHRLTAKRAGSNLTLDVAANGAAVVAWSSFEEGFLAAVKPAGGSFGPPEHVPGASVGTIGGASQTSIDDGGAVLFATRSYESRGAMQEPASAIVVTTRSPNGRFSEPQKLSADGDTSNPQVAAGPVGEAVVAWAEGDWEAADLKVSVRGPTGTFSAPVKVAGPNLWRVEPQVGMDGAGNAILTWPEHQNGQWRILAAHRPPLGEFRGARSISDPAIARYEARSYPDPRLAIGGPGNAIVTWFRDVEDEDGVVIEAAMFDVAPPRVPDFDVVVAPPVPRATAARARTAFKFRWEVSEHSKVTIALRRRGRQVRTFKTPARPGRNVLRAARSGLRRGRYTAVLRATDRLGHVSQKRQTRFRLGAR